MARIRTIKPEFWSSPSVAKCSAVGRLAFIAMWNWADDHGRGTANLKELEGFIFPNDDVKELSSGNTAHFRDVVAEVVACFNVVFYEADGRPYYEIPTWDDHQRNERRAAQSKHPEPTGKPAFSWLVAEIPCNDTVDPNISGPGTGEQGYRGTGLQGNSSSSAVADAPADKEIAAPRHDVEELLDYLDAGIRANDAKTPGRNKGNTTAMRLLIDKDGRDVEQIKAAIDFATNDEFWRSNILSAPTLRKQYDRLRMKAQDQNWKRPNDRHARESQFWEDERASMAGLGEPPPTNHLEIEAS